MTKETVGGKTALEWQDIAAQKDNALKKARVRIANLEAKGTMELEGLDIYDWRKCVGTLRAEIKHLSLRIEKLLEENISLAEGAEADMVRIERLEECVGNFQKIPETLGTANSASYPPEVDMDELLDSGDDSELEAELSPDVRIRELEELVDQYREEAKDLHDKVYDLHGEVEFAQRMANTLADVVERE